MSVSFITFGFQLRRLNTCFKEWKSGEAKKDVRVKWVSKREQSIGECENCDVKIGVRCDLRREKWNPSAKRFRSVCIYQQLRFRISSHAFEPQICDLKGKTISNRIEGEWGAILRPRSALACLSRAAATQHECFIVCSLVMLLAKRANWLRAKRSKLNEKEMKLHLAVAVITSGRDAVERISTLAIERVRIKRRLASTDLPDKCFGSFNLTVCPTDIDSGICAKGMSVYMSSTIDSGLIVAQGCITDAFGSTAQFALASLDKKFYIRFSWFIDIELLIFSCF